MYNYCLISQIMIINEIIITDCPPAHVQGYLVDRKQGIDKCWPYQLVAFM